MSNMYREQSREPGGLCLEEPSSRLRNGSGAGEQGLGVGAPSELLQHHDDIPEVGTDFGLPNVAAIDDAQSLQLLAPHHHGLQPRCCDQRAAIQR